LERCHRVVSIPADPAYPALNLAQSVLLFVYELRQACAIPVPPTQAGQPATQAQLERLFDLAEASLAAIGFFKYNPAAVMHSLRQVAYRAELHSQEVALLTAIARQILRAAPSQEGGERAQAVPN
jgi:tRNA C32,U32 (ribose-2'-O)-methylase TrmJ